MAITFNLNNATEILFGKGQIAALSRLVSPGSRVFLLYGGGSIKKNGVHDQVVAALSAAEVVEFGGVEANPEYETILAAARLYREKKCEIVLAVGGGSVIDAAKFLATILPIDAGKDAWDELVAGNMPAQFPQVGVVLTLPATGAESNPVPVISRKERGLKVPFSNEGTRPKYAVLDPSTMESLPRRQLENGVVDAVTHVLEQYLTVPVNTPVQFGMSEAVLESLFDSGPKLVDDNSEAARETVMWAANQALNGLIGSGVPQDWSTHMIGHAITAIHGIDHARTLSMVMPSVLRYKLDQKLPMLARYARRVWKIDDADDKKAALEAIARTEAFFHRMGCPVSLKESGIEASDFEAIVDHVDKAGQMPLGENKDIYAEDIRAILRKAA